jgi:hypothetical protein
MWKTLESVYIFPIDNQTRILDCYLPTTTIVRVRYVPYLSNTDLASFILPSQCTAVRHLLSGENNMDVNQGILECDQIAILSFSLECVKTSGPTLQHHTLSHPLNKPPERHSVSLHL